MKCPMAQIQPEILGGTDAGPCVPLLEWGIFLITQCYRCWKQSTGTFVLFRRQQACKIMVGPCLACRVPFPVRFILMFLMKQTFLVCIFFFLVFLNVNLLFGQRVAVAFRAVWALENKTRQPEELRGVSCPLPQPQPQPPSIHPSIRPIWQESSCLCADFPRGVWSWSLGFGGNAD